MPGLNNQWKIFKVFSIVSKSFQKCHASNGCSCIVTMWCEINWAVMWISVTLSPLTGHKAQRWTDRAAELFSLRSQSQLDEFCSICKVPIKLIEGLLHWPPMDWKNYPNWLCAEKTKLFGLCPSASQSSHVATWGAPPSITIRQGGGTNLQQSSGNFYTCHRSEEYHRLLLGCLCGLWEEKGSPNRMEIPDFEQCQHCQQPWFMQAARARTAELGQCTGEPGPSALMEI